MAEGKLFKPGKVALVLAGGGLTGVVYEAGALRAIDDLLIDRTVNDFDIYVGTSAGAIVSSVLANGISPEALLQAMEGSHPEIQAIERKHIFRMNTRGLMKAAMRLPFTLSNAWAHYLRNITDMTLVDLLWSLTEILPSGLYDGMALEGYLRQILSKFGKSNNFADLLNELYIIATDLDTGKRAVFGNGYIEDTTVSLAAAASSALPIVYKPVRIGDKEYIDGGMRGNASLDLAIEHGATLIICINPMVPYDNHDHQSIPFLGPDGGYLSEKGIQAIANQVSRIIGHSSLHYHVKQLRRMHPEVDIILIEPRPDDYQMFFYNIMRYSARMTVARHGFEAVTIDLAEDFATYREILARHGIPITRRLVIQELAEIHNSDYDPDVIRRVLEARQPGCSRGHRDTPQCRLNQSLAQLDMILERM
ncbi:MAG TPA: patatin family protein [Anaerolineales bacterium]|nr:patatin family protein [Anaerolineales bacterium]